MNVVSGEVQVYMNIDTVKYQRVGQENENVQFNIRLNFKLIHLYSLDINYIESGMIVMYIEI